MTKKRTILVVAILLSSLTVLNYACKKDNPITESEIMTIKVENIAEVCDDCYADTPAISTNSDGTNYITVAPGSYSVFVIIVESPKLYMWTCPSGDESCNWTVYDVPTIIGHSFIIDQNNPMHRNLKLTRIN